MATSRQSSLIIILEGVPGVGKTTLASALTQELGLTHHLSTGFMRAAMEPFLSESQARLIRSHSFTAYEEIDGMKGPVTPERILRGCIAQTELMKPVMRSCIQRAKREGIGMVLEGSHFVPGAVDYKEWGADLMVVLDVPDREELKKRALSPNHRLRHLSDYDLKRMFMLQEQLLIQARHHSVPVVVNADLKKAVKDVKALVACLA
jgi:2-phosphoglycerate kinase